MSAKITAELIKELRERTGVGMGKCKEALEEAGGDIEMAIDNLRKAGMASAVKKEGRETNEGLIGFAENANAASFAEVNAETDFVTQNERFKGFLEDVCKDALASKPKDLEQFLQQKYSKDPSITIDQYRALIVQSLGENIKVSRVLVLEKSKDTSVGIYSHMGGKIVTAVVIEGASGLENLAKDIGMHIAAESPDFLKPEEVPADIRAREEEIAKSQVVGKPANIIDKIVEGKINAFYDQVCLLRQKYVKDPSISITQLLEREGKKIGKNLTIRSYIRWQIGG
ncbi:MAG: elongation factor Ts [Chlamydiae bacterium]|nr:elongation factor Ts [Chlamydiota bacterium]